MQLVKDIYLVSGSPYAKHPNVYAVKGNNAIVLIDTGLDEEDLKIVEENLKYWGLSEYPLTHVLLTHSHFDHCGNAYLLKARGALIAAGAGDADSIEQGDDRTIKYAYGRKFPACSIDIRVCDGDIIKAAGLEFETVNVPGHSSGSVFYKLSMDNKVILFTGDSVLVDEDCSSARLGWTGGIEYDSKLYKESLKKVAELKCDVLLGGHYQPCLKDGWKILKFAYGKIINEFADGK